jgi:capsular exopolysaccharide synthesis family protein
LGLFGGLLLAFIVESLDATLNNVKSIETAAALPVLAKIPRASKKEVQMAANDNSALAEAFRNLALSLLMLNQQKNKKILLIIGAEPKQGKSTVVHNLAIALAEYGKNVVVVDCDMRLPKIHELFNIANDYGLKDVIEKAGEAENQLAKPVPCVSVLTSGSCPVNPSQLLGSSHMAKIVKTLHQQFDYILLDTPALLAVSDTKAIVENVEIVKNVDAFILVVRQSHAKRETVKLAGNFLKSIPDKYACVVINHSDNTASYSYYRSVQKNVKQIEVVDMVQVEKSA